MGIIKRFEVYLVLLDPTVGKEIQKTRPCVVISPNEIHWLMTPIVAPMTTKVRSYPTRIPTTFDGKNGYVVLDQIRTVDTTRFVKLLGTIDRQTSLEILKILQEMFI